MVGKKREGLSQVKKVRSKCNTQSLTIWSMGSQSWTRLSDFRDCPVHLPPPSAPSTKEAADNQW